jgi:hypothetical protein
MLPVVVIMMLWSCSVDSQVDDDPIQKVDPPFHGTIFIDPDIITAEDPSTFSELTFAGSDSRTMFDRRVNDWITDEPFLFIATYDDGLSIEFQINSEFETKKLAEVQALRFAEVIGRLPTALRKDVETSWIHKGDELFGGGNNNLLIHIEQADKYIADGILEETFVHEASHTSLDAYHKDAQDWLAAQDADPAFISTYARDNPEREDIAESFLPYLAIRYRSERISSELKDQIEEAIPHRIAYFDDLGLDLYPIE